VAACSSVILYEFCKILHYPGQRLDSVSIDCKNIHVNFKLKHSFVHMIFCTISYVLIAVLFSLSLKSLKCRIYFNCGVEVVSVVRSIIWQHWQCVPKVGDVWER
jgi:hypothetical protein